MEILAHISEDSRLTYPLPLPEPGFLSISPVPEPEGSDHSLELAGSDFLLGC